MRGGLAVSGIQVVAAMPSGYAAPARLSVATGIDVPPGLG